MAKRRVLKITPVLVTLNILVLLLIAGFYTTRLIKYYLKENGHKNSEEAVLLVDAIKKKQSFLDETKGLVLDEEAGIYRYKGEVDDNYVLYSGMIYRIISVDKENRIKLVSENNVTLMYPGFKNGYKDSYVNKWLNSSDAKYSGIYENALVNSDVLLEETKFCEDTIDDVTNITCEKETDDYKITMLSLYDYKLAGGKSSYLNNGEMFYFGSLDKDNNSYYVTSEGELALNQKESKAITIKPVITLTGDSELLSGKGTLKDPYVIEKHDVTILGEAYVNNIISINDKKYKIVEILDDKVKVASVDVLMDKDDKLSIAFGGSNSAYSSSNTVGKYLNNTFLNSLDIKNSVVNGDYYITTLTLANLDYASLRGNKVTTKVAMLTMGDMFVNEGVNVFTTLRGMEASNMINIINENGNFFADTISSKYNVRPAFYLKYDLNIKSGSGTLDDPYKLGDNNEGKKEEE
jgi:hypothetical protein